MSEAKSGVDRAIISTLAPDIAEPVIGPAGGGTRWLIRATRQAFSHHDRADREEIEEERRHLPQDECRHIGKERKRRCNAEEERRIVPAVERRRTAEDFLFAGVLACRVERSRRLAVEHIGSRRINVGEVGAEGPPHGVVSTVGRRRHIGECHREGGDKREAHKADSLASHEIAVANCAHERADRSTHDIDPSRRRARRPVAPVLSTGH